MRSFGQNQGLSNARLFGFRVPDFVEIDKIPQNGLLRSFGTFFWDDCTPRWEFDETIGIYAKKSALSHGASPRSVSAIVWRPRDLKVERFYGNFSKTPFTV